MDAIKCEAFHMFASPSVYQSNVLKTLQYQSSTRVSKFPKSLLLVQKVLQSSHHTLGIRRPRPYFSEIRCHTTFHGLIWSPQCGVLPTIARTILRSVNFLNTP